MIVDGAFAGLEAMYQMADGEGRVMVLVELISKPVQLHVAPASLRKLALGQRRNPSVLVLRDHKPFVACGIIRSSVEQIFAADFQRIILTVLAERETARR